MPTPLGHALAGAAIAWSGDALRSTPLTPAARWRLAAACTGLAVCPDLDFLYPPVHRMMTHSLVAVALAGIVAAVMARRSGAVMAGEVAVLCMLAYASHLLLDWLGGDTKLPAGIQLLWPFSDRWFISSWHIFRATDLGGFFTVRIMMSNTLAVLRELLVLAPLALAAWVWRRRRLAAARRG